MDVQRWSNWFNFILIVWSAEGSWLWVSMLSLFYMYMSCRVMKEWNCTLKIFHQYKSHQMCTDHQPIYICTFLLLPCTIPLCFLIASNMPSKKKSGLPSDNSAASGFSTIPCIFVIMTYEIKHNNDDKWVLYNESAFWKRFRYAHLPWLNNSALEMSLYFQKYFNWANKQSLHNINRSIKNSSTACSFSKIAEAVATVHKFHKGKFASLLNHTIDIILFDLNLYPSQRTLH